VTIDPAATLGATFGVDFRWPDGTLVTAADFNTAPDDPERSVSRTMWSLVLDIPPNVTALETAAGTGLYAITGAGTSATRTLQDGVGILIANADGVAGDPTVDLFAALDDLVNVDTTGALNTWVLTYDFPTSTWIAAPATGGGGGGVASVSDGTGIDVDNTDPINPIVNLDSASIASLALADSATQPGDLGTAAFTSASAYATAAQGATADSAVQSVVAGTNVSVDNTDPQNPIVSATGGGGGVTLAQLATVALLNTPFL
jgi:hypothetical protein